MKTLKSILTLQFILCLGFISAQIEKKITDSTHIEKINKMPMDTVKSTEPVNPVPPSEKPEKKKSSAISPTSKKEK